MSIFVLFCSSLILHLQFPKLCRNYGFDCFYLFFNQNNWFLCFGYFGFGCVDLFVVVVNLHQVLFLFIHIFLLMLRQLIDLILYFLKLLIIFQQFRFHCFDFNSLYRYLTILILKCDTLIINELLIFFYFSCHLLVDLWKIV